MKPGYDIAIIGAGPAGMAAAITAANAGASVVLLDEQSTGGGQIYRAVARQSLADREILGPEYYQGLELVDQLRASPAEHVTGATVWQVSREREIGLSRDGISRLLNADQIIIATGAIERPFPVPGWTLPGVMGAGAAQVLLKTSGITFPDAVFVGTGPLLYLVAHQYVQAGVTISAILDTTPRGGLLRALPSIPAALTQAGHLIKGRRWISQIRAAGVPFVRGVQDVRCIGDAEVRAVEYRKAGRWAKIDTHNVFLHQGVVPNTNLAVAAGCNHVWNEAQLCWQAQTDAWGHSDIPGIAVAGDGRAINGALAARLSGQITALGALCRGGFITTAERDEQAANPRKRRASETRIRPFLDRVFQPPGNFRIPQGDATLVCRCEEVTAGEIRQAVAQGCQDTNQLKSFTRCGMGPCQGRFCGLTASEIIAQELRKPVSTLAMARQRPVVKPLALDELANIAAAPADGA